jgi:hypothetical protein
MHLCALARLCEAISRSYEIKKAARVGDLKEKYCAAEIE